MKQIMTALFAVALLASAFSATAAKPGSGGASIRIEALGVPDGAVASRGAGINRAGTVVVGDAYWNATFESRNSWYAARWTRAPGSGAWQAEDLRPLLPPSRWSWALQVNGRGTVTVRSEDDKDGSQFRSLVITTYGTIDLGLNDVPHSLNDADEMVGVRTDPGGSPSLPLFWPSASSAAEVLPVLATGHGGEAIWFLGDGIRGTADDDTGVLWLVQWTRRDGVWIIQPLVRLPPKFGPSGINTEGRVAGTQCDTRCAMVGFEPPDQRAVVWDPPYTGQRTFLPTLAGPYSWGGSVMETGAVIGNTVARNGVDMLPVLWPTPDTVRALPLIDRAKSGLTRGNNGKQITGYVGGTAVVWTLP